MAEPSTVVKNDNDADTLKGATAFTLKGGGVEGGVVADLLFPELGVFNSGMVGGVI